MVAPAVAQVTVTLRPDPDVTYSPLPTLRYGVATFQANPGSLTGTGRSWLRRPPSPSWPRTLLPHAQTTPRSSRARLWSAPGEIPTPPTRPAICAGRAWPVVVPSPS